MLKTRSAALRGAALSDRLNRGFEHRIKRSRLRGDAAQRRHCSQYLTNARRRGLLAA